MTHNILSSETFMQGFASKEYTNGLLVMESTLVDSELEDVAADFQKLTAEKRFVAEQSGDNWHDGAFKATDEAAHTLSGRMQQLQEARNWPLVELPLAKSSVVALGSRALLKVGRGQFYCDIVGLPSLHRERYERTQEDIELTTIHSAIGKAIFGKEVGYEANAQIGNTRKHIEIISTQPSPALAEG